MHSLGVPNGQGRVGVQKGVCVHCLSPLCSSLILCTEQFCCGDLIPGFSYTACYLLANSTKFCDARLFASS